MNKFKAKAWHITSLADAEALALEVGEMYNQGWMPVGEFPFLHQPLNRPGEEGGQESSIFIKVFVLPDPGTVATSRVAEGYRG